MQRIVKRRCILALPFLLLLLALLAVTNGPAAASDLDDAKRAGTVGETARGYIAPVAGSTAATTQLVNQINAQRRQEYQSLAQKHGATLDQIEAMVGQRLIERSPSGTFVQGADGRWRRK